jgi:hypothetical protein
MNCSICLEDITKETGSTTLSCEHTFHLRCIVKWFAEQDMKDMPESCPYCRSEGNHVDRACFKEIYGDEEEEEEESEEEEEDTNFLEDESTYASLVEDGWQVEFYAREDGTVVRSIRWSNPNSLPGIQAPVAASQEQPQPQPQAPAAASEEQTPEQLQQLHQDAITLYRQILSTADRQEDAVRKLQAVWRGYQARKEYKTAKVILKLSHEQVSSILSQMRTS